MTLFMTELAVADFAASLAWYRDVLGLRVKHLDSANQFVLFDGGVALKAGVPTPGGVRLHFNVSDLAAELTRVMTAGVAASPIEEQRGLPRGIRRRPRRLPDRAVRVATKCGDEVRLTGKLCLRPHLDLDV